MKAPEDREGTLARYLEGPALLERSLAGVADAALDLRPSRGGWTIRQIVHHLVDGDDLWKIGIKVALGNEGAEFSLDWYRTRPQEVWAGRWAYADRPLDASLALLRAIRAHVDQLVRRAPDAWGCAVRFRGADGGIERLPVGAIVAMQADHVEHHVRQIRAIRAEAEAS